MQCCPSLLPHLLQVPRTGPPAGFEYTRENVSEFRKPFLERRLSELRAVLHALAQPASEQAYQTQRYSTAVQDILGALDLSRLVLAGHSFGGATVVKAEQDLGLDIQGSVVLDLWPFPLPKTVTAKGLTSAPSLFINRYCLVSCHIMPLAVPVLLSCLVLSCFVLSCVVLFCVAFHCCCGVAWCGVVWCVVLCCVVLCCVVLCCVVLCCVVLCCGVVWCVVLCCVVLCCIVWCCVVVRCGVVWCCVVCCVVVLCCVVWCVVWCGVPKVLLPNGNGQDGIAYG